MPTPTHAQQLLSLLARTSFKLGQFKLSSGGTSDYYIDCRTTTLHAEGGRLTGHAILELLEANKIDAEAVGGLTMGADPIVSNVATASAWRALSHPNRCRCSMASSSARPKKLMAQAAVSKDSSAKARAWSSSTMFAPPAPPPSPPSRQRRRPA